MPFSQLIVVNNLERGQVVIMFKVSRIKVNMFEYITRSQRLSH